MWIRKGAKNLFCLKSNNNKILIKGVTQVLREILQISFGLSINYKGLISISNAHSQVGSGMKKGKRKIIFIMIVLVR